MVDAFSIHPRERVTLADHRRYTGGVVGTIRGYEYPKTVMEAKARGMVLDENISEQANLQKLALGRIDAAMVMSNP